MDINTFKIFVVLLLLFTTLRARNSLLMTMLTIAYVTLFSTSLLWLAYMLIGLLLSPLAFSLTFFISYRRCLPSFFPLDFGLPFRNPEIAIQAFNEEIVWRDFVLLFFLKNSNTKLQIVFVIVFTATFVAMHEHAREKRQFVEFFCFSLMLMVSCMFCFGLHYGLHIGRNYILLTYQKKGMLI